MASACVQGLIRERMFASFNYVIFASQKKVIYTLQYYLQQLYRF